MRSPGALLTVLAALLLFAMALPACGSAEPPNAGEPATTGAPDTTPARGIPADTTVPVDLACEDLASDLLPVAPTRAGLSGRFGPPDSIAVRAVENRHVRGQTDTILTVHYDGLTSEIYAVTGGRELPDHVLVSDGRFLVVPALGPGAPAERVVRALGEPTRRTASSLVYMCGMDVDQPVTFHLREGVVTRIEIDYYVD